MDPEAILGFISMFGSAFTGYKVKRIAEMRRIKKIIDSGLLDSSSMEISEIDIQRACEVIDLTDSGGINTDELPTYRLKIAARSLDSMGGAYSKMFSGNGDYFEKRKGFYSSWGVELYIDKRFIEDHRPDELICPMAEHSGK